MTAPCGGLRCQLIMPRISASEAISRSSIHWRSSVVSVAMMSWRNKAEVVMTGTPTISNWMLARFDRSEFDRVAYSLRVAGRCARAPTTASLLGAMTWGGLYLREPRIRAILPLIH